MIPLTGYGDRLSARPGETIAFKISSDGDAPYDARLVRIVSADPNPEGPGIIEEAIDADFAGSYPSRIQPFYPGSYAKTQSDDPLPGLDGFTAIATIWPTTPLKEDQAILAHWDGSAGFALMVGAGGKLKARIGTEGGQTEISLGEPLRERQWYRAWASFDGQTLALGQLPLGNALAAEQADSASVVVSAPARLGTVGPITIAALADQSAYFNGKIEAPAIYGRAIAEGAINEAFDRTEAEGLRARWDFSRGIDTLRIEDTGPNGLHGEIVNLPARGMTGAAWSGHETCWRHAPAEYGAIHFHDDDIYNCNWDTDFTFTIPEGLKSGIYGVRLTCGAHEDTIPFYVCPPRGKRTADLCVLGSVFTFIIYGNFARPDFGPHWRERVADWGAYPHNPWDQPEYGFSTYNFHSDGSGINHASHLRPLMSLRPGYIHFATGTDSGIRHFQADTHLIAWLEHQGIDYDILTDRELHEEGADALKGYRAVTTGSHPEYHTAETLDALEGYRDQGGNLSYLGGNGFYWRVALHKEEPGAIEIRRGEGGIRAWAAEPGEYFNAFDGEYGGLWRRNGRPPQRLAGVGFSAQGLFEGSYYRKRAEATDPRVAWMFAGIDDELLGDFGFSGGGAAGFELDRADTRLGTPENALVVASSEKHQSHFVLVPEEQLTHVSTWNGEPPDELIRADMTYFETPSGGAVFSTGSITFCGSLPWNDFDNNISRLLGNVMDRFLGRDG